MASDGTIHYDTASIAAQLQALAAGQVLTDKLTYAIQLGNGTLSWATTIVQFTGTNDKPVITSGPQTGAVVEDAPTTPDLTDSLNAAGTIAFNDVDLIDGHTASFAATAGETALGTFSLDSVSEAAGAAAGSVQWHYALNNAAAQYLAAGQSVVEHYTVTVDDGHGGTATQVVAVTINGTNDKPVITSGPQTGAVVEDAPTTPDLTVSLNAAGTIAFNDVDLIDGHTASFAATAGETALGTFSLDSVSEAAGAAAGSVQWHYALNAAAAQYLAAGQSVVEHYTVTVDDGHGGTVEQLVTVTIHGTNDDPTITVAGTDADGAVTEDTTAPTLSDTGTIAFNDIDLIDTHTTSVAPDAGNTLGGTLTMGAVSEDGATQPGTVGWTYEVANAATQYLAAGETATEKFTVTVDDGHGGTVEQLVTVTIHGTND
ncbi:VCBS domain-containing protein, partial [Mesorhizobium sp. BR1-1-3]|uniref:VCBS domain-containing protein n=1 Tax=Mesorhizobium sp. BR1-1-3 TaxID=2876651 RepID=UPI0021E3418F